MSFLAILFALLLEQARPLAPTNFIHGAARGWVRWVHRNFDAGQPRHAWLSWGISVGAPTVFVLGLHWALLWGLGWGFALAWNIAVLYATLGFRQFSHHFTRIRDALSAGDEPLARQHLAHWMRIDASELPRSEIIRHVIEYSVISAHRHVFGVFAWYSVVAAFGLGPAGAVLYRMAEYLSREVNLPFKPGGAVISEALKSFAGVAWQRMDWAPSRITAMSFAFVGSFEDAVDQWRQHEAMVANDNDGVVLASTSGAVNVKLGSQAGTSTAGEVPQAAHLRSVVGLLWRSVVMWMVVLALLSLARLLG